MANKFSFNQLPAFDQEYLDLMESLRGITIELMRYAYPGAYTKSIDGEYRYVAKKKPLLRISKESLISDIEDIYTKDIKQITEFENFFRPEFEDLGFEKIVEHILPSVMNSGAQGDFINLDVMGMARCMDCIREAIKSEGDTAGLGFFKLPKSENTHIKIAKIEDIVNNWRGMLPTDSKVASNEELLKAITPEYCLASKSPNYKHKDIVLLSTVIASEHIKIGLNGNERVKGSNFFHWRDKAGCEMLRKITNYLIGKEDNVTDGIACRSVVPDEDYAKVFVKVLRDYPFKNNLDGSLYASNYTRDNLKSLLELGRETLDKPEYGYLQKLAGNILFDEKDTKRKRKGKEQLVTDIEWTALFGLSDDIIDKNVTKMTLYDETNYKGMNSHEGFDTLDYQKRRDRHAKETWTAGQWMIYCLLAPTISYFPALRRYAEEMGEIRLREAMQ